MTDLSDEEAMAQVVDAARHISRAAALHDVTGGFVFESCNDQGAPPFRGRVDMSFTLMVGVEPDEQFSRIAAAMMREGWAAGPPSGKCPFGAAVHTDKVMAIICRASSDAGRGSVQVVGECRNMSDHRHDGKTVGVDITAQLSGS
jgi:hypothetical protein